MVHVSGPRHANKSARPIVFIRNVCSDALTDDIKWEPTAYAVDVLVEVVIGGKQYTLQGCPAGVITHFIREPYERWLRKEVELLDGCNDPQDLVDLERNPRATSFMKTVTLRRTSKSSG